MCGIAGIVRFDRPATASATELRAMRGRLAHRGPDGVGEVFGSVAALAHTRLAMVDREGGAQPFASPDGRHVLVYNGELYNHDELRRELPGPWRTRSDTETLLAAWLAWGDACVERLDGMFAFFLWDEVAQRGFAARDRLGVKPFAYTLAGGFAFASEAQALLPVLGRPRANPAAIVEYLVAPAFSGVAASPFAGVHYLQPGHVLHVERAGVTTRRYWRWDVQPGPVEPHELRGELERAVSSALRSDVPLGVFASGGLDSTAIAAIARRHGELPAFTVTFAGQDRWRDSLIVISDDTPFARDAARALDLAHHEVACDRAALAAELAAISRVDDALPAWEQELSQRALARAAADHVRGILVGDAADETHYGYHFLLDAAAVADPAVIVKRLGCVPVRADVEADPLARLVAEYRALAPTNASPVIATTQLIVERWLPRLLHNGDIHCMAFGLEARVPFAANRLVELAARVDPAVALRGGVEKALLREALRGCIPEAIRTRRKSALPKDQATAAVFRSEARTVLAEPHPIVAGFVDREALAQLLAPERPLAESERAQLFRVICLHHWATAHGVAA
jgi:asparagine synthase (glutamine-hydrolysing)